MLQIYVPQHGVPSVVCKIVYKNTEYRARFRASWPCVLFTKRSAKRPYEATPEKFPMPELYEEYRRGLPRSRRFFGVGAQDVVHPVVPPVQRDHEGVEVYKDGWTE
jgi:hypothetical protein